MEPRAGQPSVGCAEELAEPGYWFVAGLEWPGGSGLAEAALAVAPELIPRDHLGHDAYQVLGCSDLYARKHCTRVVFFSDLTRMFAAADQSWAALGVDWRAALRELEDGPFPAMFLTISERAHLIICDPATGHAQTEHGSSTEPPGCEREVVRQALADKLTADWPAFINGLIESRRVTPFN
jgi:hypothetical protein